jgi:hypothetical protein
VTRKHKQGLKYTVGDEITFYQNKQIRTGTVCFVGSGFLSVYPSTAEVLGTNGEPMRDIEYIVKEGEII